MLQRVPGRLRLYKASELGSSGGTSYPLGQCVLAKSGSNLVLSPKNGNQLWINGALCTVPDAGVSLSASGLSSGTTYLIYAYMSAGTMTLEASTTAHATSTTSGNKGVEIKSGDNTRSLVGMARVISGPAWADTATQRFVQSWFNRTPVAGNNAFTANRTTASTSYVELNTEIRIEFVCWADQAVDVSTNGAAFINSASFDYIYTSVGFDGTTNNDSCLAYSNNTYGIVNAGLNYHKTGLSEGYHYATVLGRTAAGFTGSWGDGATKYVTMNLVIG